MLLVNFLLWILSLSTKEDYIMAICSIYCSLILKGKKTVGDVPIRIRQQVVDLLIDLEVDASIYKEYVDENNKILEE